MTPDGARRPAPSTIGRQALAEICKTPDGLPMLSAHGHANPQEGACFMEYAALLAGERFSDQPRCTHPLLATVARIVNDTVTDAERQKLLPLVPMVIGVRGPSALMTSMIVTTVTGAALRVKPDARGLLRFQQRAARRQAAVRGASGFWIRTTDWAYQSAGARHAVEASLRVLAPMGSAALGNALHSAIAAARAAGGLPPLDAAEIAAGSVAVTRPRPVGH